MGYPMTYDRVIRRNGLDQGDYLDSGKVPWPAIRFNPTEQAVIAAPGLAAAALSNVRSSVANLLGDLRRFERDSLDENPLGVIARISKRTGVSFDDTAAVIREFMRL